MWEKLAWDATRKYIMASFTEKMGDMVKTYQKAADWLDLEERRCWARAYFDHTLEAFKSTYHTHIHHIANQEDWEIIIDPEDLVNPPEFKPQVGRPKKQRIRDEDEPEAISKFLRKCGKCGKLNHNTRTCDTRKNGTRPKKRGKKSEHSFCIFVPTYWI
ncbi:hypothetical protein IFM89_013955 [Coptis chinensis]|uniref:CCHC-type domain-containing protein n=1 Tax=Coptis chinensis TaxID=261450 RepID=A0A835HEJ3_9MAGN|nr:hypothetical protein IFM89_013955 [Coptis chinensis]